MSDVTRGQESQGAEAMNRNIREPGGSKEQGAEGAAQQSSHLPDDFGDLEQYVELSHIGSGEA